MKKIDLTGKQFGRLTVVKQGTNSDCGRFLRWHCICACGTKTLVHGGALKSGNSKSCGCLIAERSGASQRTHGEGHKPSKEYRAWLGMKARCYNKNEPKFTLYGGRGIRVCQRWLDSYEDFLSDMGRAPTKAHSLDRKDTNGDYDPSNCKWSTATEQMNNVRYNRIIYRPDGSPRTVAQLARETGIKYQTLLQRVRNGWHYDRLITPP